MPRQRFRDKLETWFVVTVITVLIWLYAEGAIVQTYQRQRVPLEFVPADGIPAVIEPAQTRAYVTFRGSSGQFQLFKNRLEQGPVRVALQPGEQPTQDVDITEALEQSLFNDLGIAIEEVDPDREPVNVRRLVTRTVPVTLQRGNLKIKGDPNINLSSVNVTLPEDLAEFLDHAVIPLDRAIASLNLPPNMQHVLTLDIELPPAVRSQWTKLQTPQAEVSFTLAKGDDTLVLPTVPLRDVTPLSFAYEVTPVGGEKVIRDVTLTGPSDTLARIADNDPGYPVWAELHFFDATELTPGPRTVDVYLRTPPGVQASGLRQITVNLTPKTPPANGNGNAN